MILSSRRQPQSTGVQILDVRKNNERDVAHRKNIREECLRIHTVGQDCSVGKMLVALELTNAMKAQGIKAKFIATGQTGIMVEGDGSPIDCVVSDFVSGAVEKMILAHQHNDVLFIEGQGSLSHPRYSGRDTGTAAWLYATRNDSCATKLAERRSTGWTRFRSNRWRIVKVYETMANLMVPSRVIGVAMNSRKVSAEDAERERERIRQELGLPVCDVIRHGPDELLQAVQQLVPATTVA